MSEQLDPRTIVFPKWPKVFEGLTEEQCERVMEWHTKECSECEDKTRKEENSRYWRAVFFWMAVCAVLFVIACK